MHLRFDVVARSPIKLGGYQAGERLRDALAQVMLRAVCPETSRAQKPSAEHAATCPACWLLAAELDPGEVRRAYALVPPIPPLDVIERDQRFSFTLTLFGQGFQYLPYFVLAVPEMGRVGVGPGRGTFELEDIWNINPLAGAAEAVLQKGENVVRVPKICVDWQTVEAAYKRLEANLPRGKNLRLRFFTPTRLIDEEALVKTPDFSVFFYRLLLRIDQVGQQYGGSARRFLEDVEHLHSLADQVRLVENETDWVELWGPSNRTGRRTPMGGFVGWADYRVREWGDILPWLVFGQGIQAGKLAVKGNGIYQIEMPGEPGYWERVFGDSLTDESGGNNGYRPASGG
jgi:hypothetical protein